MTSYAKPKIWWKNLQISCNFPSKSTDTEWKQPLIRFIHFEAVFQTHRGEAQNSWYVWISIIVNPEEKGP